MPLQDTNPCSIPYEVLCHCERKSGDPAGYCVLAGKKEHTSKRVSVIACDLSSDGSPNANNATYTLNAGGRGCSALFVLFIFFITLQSFLLNKHAAQRHVTNCFFDQTIAVNVICLSFACLFLFPTSTIVSCGGPYANSRRTPTQSVGGLATGHRRHKKKTTKTVVLFFMVPVAGLEPARYRYRWILSPLRLPIPSHRHKLLNHSSTTILFLQLI